jgi:hypothetical protein
LPSELVLDGEIAGVVETVNVVKKLINNSQRKDKGNLSPLYSPLLSIEVCLLS